MIDDKHRYHPRRIEEIEGNGISLINEPVREDVIDHPGARSTRPLHAVLCEALTNTQALLARLESGVHVPRGQQRETVRALYVATRHQVKALAACLELDGLE